MQMPFCSTFKGPMKLQCGKNPSGKANAMTCVENCVKFALKCLLRDTLKCLILLGCVTFLNVWVCKVKQNHWLDAVGVFNIR